MSIYQKAFQARVDIHRDLAEDMPQRGFLATAARILGAAGKDAEGLTPPDLLSRARWIAQHGELFTLTEQMHQLAEAAGSEFPAQAGIAEHDPPDKQGMMYLPVPLELMDINGYILRHQVVMWSQVGADHLLVIWFTNSGDPGDEINQDFLADNGYGPLDWGAFGKWQLSDAMVLDFDAPLPKDTGMGAMVRNMFGQAGHAKAVVKDGKIVGYHFDKGYAPDELSDTLDRAFEPVPASSYTYILAAWRLMAQTIVSLEEDRPARPSFRMAQRLDIEPKFTVVMLRHRSHRETHEETQVEWSHRWLRRGHWRRQNFKDADGDWDWKWVYIHQTICGPEDKPLRITKHVTALVR